MEIKKIRNWLGRYFLILTAFLTIYLIILPETVLLPIGRPEANLSLQIILPVLVGQLTIMFKWYGSNPSDDETKHIDIPIWVVKGPPIFIALLIGLSLLNMIVGNWDKGYSWTISSDISTIF